MDLMALLGESTEPAGTSGCSIKPPRASQTMVMANSQRYTNPSMAVLRPLASIRL